MGVDTKIEWCDKTFNPWIGCTKVSPGCANCYAERQDKHRRWTPDGWGEGKPRKRTSVANWKQVERWDYISYMSQSTYDDLAPRLDYRWKWKNPRPNRPRVFVGSLMDWLDPEVPIEWLADLLDLIRRCPDLDFLMLTKRPELWKERLEQCIWHMGKKADDLGAVHPLLGDMPKCFEDNGTGMTLTGWLNGNPPSNVWIGTTVEDQKRAEDRIPTLLYIPAKVRFLSCEPLLEEVSLRFPYDIDTYECAGPFPCYGPNDSPFNALHWVICGGESGPNAGPMHPEWARSLRDQCQAAGVPFFFKQWGEWAPAEYNPDSGIVMVSGHGKYTSRPEWHKFEDGQRMARIGKKATGRLLDGREWNEYPSAEGGE